MIAAFPDAETVAATIDPTEAARMRWQVVVIGAGPAGTAAAWRLAARGIRTLLVDRQIFPRGKICGCCLSTRALRELAALGQSALPACAVPLTTVHLAHRGRAARICLPAGRVVSRTALDAHLIDRAIAAGCHWLPGMQVSALDDRTGRLGQSVDLLARSSTAPAAGPLSVHAELVVVATGLSDLVRIGRARDRADDARRIAPGSRIGVGGLLPATSADLPTGELVMTVGREGYCGIVRLDDGTIDVAAAFDRAAVARDAGPAEAVARLLDEAAGGVAAMLPDADAIRAATFRATPPLTRRAPLVAGEARRILRIGDAAGYVEPFTGEGMGWALASGRILVDAVVGSHGLLPPADAAARYEAAHRRAFAPLHARCQFVARNLRRPTVVAAALAAAEAMPWVTRRLVPAMLGATTMGGSR